MKAIKTQLPRAHQPLKKAKAMTLTAPQTIAALQPAAKAQDKTTTSPIVRSLATWANLPIPETVDQLLVDILAWPRRHNTMSEHNFQAWLSAHLTAMGRKPTVRAEGALTVDVPYPDGRSSTTLFSCHTDTVDGEGDNKDPSGRKKLDYDANFGWVMLAKDNNVGTCLGADDGVGVWIMLKMIAAKVPGSYVFNRGEECGGVSAKALANKAKDWLEKFQVAVAFDRPNDYEVITHQRSQRCASDRFGSALAKLLNDANDAFNFKTSDRGVYTDTADWRFIIPECCNVGVGYTNQHGPAEKLDYSHAHALMEVCCKVDWESLPVDRDPKAQPATPYHYGGYKHGSLWDDDAWGTKAKAKASKTTKAAKAPEPELRIEDEVLYHGSLADWENFAETDPEATAAMLLEMAAEIAGLRAKVAAYKKTLLAANA